MQSLELINKTREYLDYLEEHINNVQKAWQELKTKCKDMPFIYDDYYYHWLNNEIYKHDTSKFSPEEFVQYRQSFYHTDYDPINYRLQFEEAWEHHKKHNRHHWENWTTKSYHDPNAWVVDCAHMVIDWMAMGYKFNDTAQKYYEKNKDKIKLPDYAEKFIYKIFERLA